MALWLRPSAWGNAACFGKVLYLQREEQEFGDTGAVTCGVLSLRSLAPRGRPSDGMICPAGCSGGDSKGGPSLTHPAFPPCVPSPRFQPLWGPGRLHPPRDEYLIIPAAPGPVSRTFLCQGWAVATPN